MGQRYRIRVYQALGKVVEVDTFTALDVHHMRRSVERAWDMGATAVDVEPLSGGTKVTCSAQAKDARQTAERLLSVGLKGAATQWLRYAELLEEVIRAR